MPTGSHAPAFLEHQMELVPHGPPCARAKKESCWRRMLGSLQRLARAVGTTAVADGMWPVLPWAHPASLHASEVQEHAPFHSSKSLSIPPSFPRIANLGLLAYQRRTRSSTRATAADESIRIRNGPIGLHFDRQLVLRIDAWLDVTCGLQRPFLTGWTEICVRPSLVQSAWSFPVTDRSSCPLASAGR